MNVLAPSLHGLIQRNGLLIDMGAPRQEVLQLRSFGSTLPGNCTGYRVGDHGKAMLQPLLRRQGAMGLPVLDPRLKFAPGQISLCFCDSTPTDAGQHEFVPDLIGGRQFFGALTSFMAAANAQAKFGWRLYACS